MWIHSETTTGYCSGVIYGGHGIYIWVIWTLEGYLVKFDPMESGYMYNKGYKLILFIDNISLVCVYLDI